MNLDETQVAKVRQWVEEGLQASEIQTRLNDELGLRMTYAEVRFLLGDLQLRPKDVAKTGPAVLGAGTTPTGAGPSAASAGHRPSGPASPSSASAGAGPAAGGPASGLKTSPLGESTPPGAGVRVTVDEIARPNMVVSGKVTFSDGQSADWGIDQMGRPMLMPKQQGYRPSQADIMDFQVELEQVLARFGY